MMQQKVDGKTKEEIKEMVGGNSSTYLRTCKKITQTAVDSIPDELLFEILLRLHAQDIYRGARLVCRKWYNMTRTKYFVQTRLEHASYGLLYRDRIGGFVFISASEDGGGIDKYKLNYTFRETIWSNCNGLILACKQSYDKSILYVTNVSTEQVFHLPPLPNFILNVWLSGIGYDATSMTYKVVASYHNIEKYYGCFIITVGVDKTWRKVRTNHLSNRVKSTIYSNPIITEGFVHWEGVRGAVVLTLNLETEIIAETSPPIPEVVFLKRTNNCHYISTGRCLSLLIPCKNFTWELFEMKSDTEEWGKLANICLEGQTGRIMEKLGFDIIHHIKNIWPCGWLKYPEVLAFRIEYSNVVFYNLITCEIGPEILSYTNRFSPVRLHKNSLVWF